MSYLPKEALTLTGGCCCKAIRYSIKVPAWDERPPIPGALDTPISTTQAVQTRMPLIDIDHCNHCREVSGAIVQVWFIAPISWVEWDVTPKDQPAEGAPSVPFHLSTVEAVGPISENDQASSTYITRFNRTDQATRAFCSRCGTTLTYLNHKRLNTPTAFVDVTLASLDRDWLEIAKPERHGWWDYGVGWIQRLLRKGDGGFLIRHHTGDVTKAVEDIPG
jgi:hypothetical protein